MRCSMSGQAAAGYNTVISLVNNKVAERRWIYTICEF
jgi:hypothetical protein